MNFDLSHHDLDSLRALYERENQELRTKLLNGALWEEVKDQRLRLTELSIALDKKLFSQFDGAFFLKESYSIFLAYSHIFTPEQLEAGSNFLLCKKNIFTSFNIRDKSNDNYILTKRTIYGKKETKPLHPECNNP